MPFRNFIEELVAGSVTADKIAVGAVDTMHLADSAVTAAKILDGSITGVLIEDGAVTANKVAAGAITATKIDAGAITASKIAINSIDSTKLQDSAVTAAKILDGTITGVLIADGEITATKIGTSAVTAAKIASNAVTAGKIQAGAVTADKISATAIDGKTITGAVVQTAATGTRAVLANNVVSAGTSSLQFRTDVTHLGGGEELEGNVVFRSGSALMGEYSELLITAENHSGGTGADARLTLQAQPYDLNRSSRIILSSDALVDENFTVTLGDITCAQMRPVTVTGASASYAATTNIGAEGTAFVAPHSGAVKITVGAFVRAITAGQATYLAFELRLGAVVGSGAIQVAQTSGNGCGNYNAQFVGSERTTIVDGLIPGNQYNVRMFHSTGAAGGVFSGPRMIVEPCM